MLELIDVSKSYKGRQVLAPLSLALEAGKVHVLIGPSGCGKSTILRLMIGLIHPDTGTVRFQGVPLKGDHLLPSRRRMGYVIQDGGLFPHLTAAANVTLMARHLKWDAGRVSLRVREMCDLTHFPVNGLGRYPAQLSGGQQQRVAVARAVVNRPNLILADEPTGNLDSVNGNEVMQILSTLHDEGASILMVTHSAENAAYSQRTIRMLDGKVIGQDQTVQ
jgi:osmoprotectant transport system ATP-binding protein